MTQPHHIDVSPWGVAIVHLSRLVIDEPRRQVDSAAVIALTESIRTLGLLQRPAVWLDDVDGRAHLVWGRHRVEAMRAINPEQSVEMIDVTALSPLERILAEIDENLKRKDLTTAQRGEEEVRRVEAAEFVEAERKAAEMVRKADVERQRAAERKRAERERTKTGVTVFGNRVAGNCDKGGRPVGSGKSERRAVVEKIAATEGITRQAVEKRIAKAQGKTPQKKPVALYTVERWRKEMDKLRGHAPSVETQVEYLTAWLAELS